MKDLLKTMWPYIIGLCILAVILESRGIFVTEDKAIKELNIQGYSDIRVIDHDWFFVSLRGGASDDAARFEAEAKNPAGKQVNITVYCGWPLKGATIRSK